MSHAAIRKRISVERIDPYNGSYDIVVQAFEKKLAITITTVSGVKGSIIQDTRVDVQFCKAEISRFEKRLCIKPLLITVIDPGKLSTVFGSKLFFADVWTSSCTRDFLKSFFHTTFRVVIDKIINVTEAI